MPKHAVVCGAGGFIGHHLVKRLKADGYSVRGLDRKKPEFEDSPADEFLLMDLRYIAPHDWALGDADEIYQLAAEMGGIGYIMDPTNDADILRSSTAINMNVLEAARLAHKKPKLFFSSSACVYTERPDSAFLSEDMAYPANMDNEYGWEKLYAERMYLAYARCYGIPVRIARLHNCYGPLGTWRGGREKAPAALCRKIAQAKHGGEIEIWGNGEQWRSFMYIDDCIEGICRLMKSTVSQPINLGSEECVTINQLGAKIAFLAGKELAVHHIHKQSAPVGVHARNSNNHLIRQLLYWEPKTKLIDGLGPTYQWIEQQIATVTISATSA